MSQTKPKQQKPAEAQPSQSQSQSQGGRTAAAGKPGSAEVAQHHQPLAKLLPEQQQLKPAPIAPGGTTSSGKGEKPAAIAAPAGGGGSGTKVKPGQPPTEHAHGPESHPKCPKGTHAFGGHCIPRGDCNDDPRKLYPEPPYDEREQQTPAIEGKMKTLPDYGEMSYSGNEKLKDKCCLITGGDSGIGRAVGLAFAREGANTVFIQHLPVEVPDAKETERLITASGAKFGSVSADLDSDEACKKMVDAAIAKMGRIDVLVLNAATQGKSVKSIDELTPDRVAKTMAVNVESLFHTVRHALPHMKPGASIVTTSSIQSYHPSAFIADYAASKGAVVNFTKSISPELLKKGIRINSVAPGPVWTPLIVQSFDKEQIETFGKDKRNEPYGRPAQPAELAPAFVFLAANCDSSYITGEVLGVTGGKFLS